MTALPLLYLHSESGGACGVIMKHGLYCFNENSKHHDKIFLFPSASTQPTSWARKDKENRHFSNNFHDPGRYFTLKTLLIS